jgi:D-3-phosphoglycerate dehydrogenase / 2-oxoglutarate reductase
MKKVLIPTKLDSVARQTLEANGGYSVVQDESGDLASLAEAHPDTYALIVRSNKVTAENIDSLPNLAVVVRAGAGFNTIDTKYARSKGIDVMNTPGANSNAVAEETIAMILADARHIVKADVSTRDGKWEKKRFMGRELAGKTVGIVGLGNIGQLVARRLSGFDVTLVGYDPVISKERAAEFDVALTDLETLFSESDYITLHVPENDDTRGLVGEALLAKARDGATIVNCARAGIVDEDALRRAREEKGIRLLNDVYAKDEAGPKSVADIADILLPHLGASTVEANYNAARRAAEQLVDLDEKGITSFIVNRDIPEGLDEAYCELANTLTRLCRCIVRELPLKLIETSFYGTLEPYADWLLVPIVAALWEDFDRSMDYHAARAHLENMGIEYVNRKVDPRKGYDNSMTIDLTGEVGPEKLRHVSVRGTVAESTLMVSRINEFNKLYFDPVGPTAMFLYDDRPGVIGTIGLALADAGINIEDMRNPHDPKTNRSLAILKVNRMVPAETIRSITDQIEARAAFSLKL